MYAKPRSYLTAGIAALGVGAIALSPVQPIPNQVALAPQHVVESMAVNLVAVIDPFGPLVDTIKTSTANLAQLITYWAENPFPFASTLLANQGTYFKELMEGNAKVIPGQILNNIKTLFTAPFSPGATFDLDGTDIATGENISKTIAVPFSTFYISKDNAYQGALQELLIAGQIDTVKSLAPILNFTNTHASALLLGALGPVVAPFLRLGKSIDAIGAALKAADFVTAFNEFINIPVKMTNAFLNGGEFLDLTNLVNAIKPLPPEFSQIGVELGGLLNLVPQNGSIVPTQPPLPTVFGGGVGFDGLVLKATLDESETTIPGLPIGLTGSSLGLARYTAKEMLVTPVPKPGATVQAAAAEAPAVTETPAPAVVEVPAPADPAAIDTPAVAAAEPAAESAPAASAPTRRKAARAAAADNGDTDRAGGRHSRSARSSR